MKPALKRYLTNSWLFPRHIGVVYIEPVMRQMKPLVRGRMLDVGCGTRRYEGTFKEVVDAYIGLDWPETDGRAFPDVVGDAMKIPLANSCVDVVLATELMEHLPSPQVFLSEVARVLCDDGTFILSVPFMEPLHEEPRDYYRFTPYSLRLLLEQHGFLVQEIWKRGGWWSVVLGSFVNQSIYNWATPLDKIGHRNYGCLTLMVLPVCALAQWLAYHLDQIFHSQRYTLGYVVLAVRRIGD